MNYLNQPVGRWRLHLNGILSSCSRVFGWGKQPLQLQTVDVLTELLSALRNGDKCLPAVCLLLFQQLWAYSLSRGAEEQRREKGQGERDIWRERERERERDIHKAIHQSAHGTMWQCDQQNWAYRRVKTEKTDKGKKRRRQETYTVRKTKRFQDWLSNSGTEVRTDR